MSYTNFHADRMSKAKTKPFDPAEYLDDSESIAVYMTEALESGDPAFVADALRVIARARRMTDVAPDAGEETNR
jgi:probable addiction module antidote protein